MPDKSKEDRLKEGLSLLKQMNDMIQDLTHPGMVELKKVISTPDTKYRIVLGSYGP